MNIPGILNDVTTKGVVVETTEVSDPNLELTLSDINQNLILQINTKQNTLISGTNIKTINGSSILGSGNLTTMNETELFQRVSPVVTSLTGVFNLVEAYETPLRLSSENPIRPVAISPKFLYFFDQNEYKQIAYVSDIITDYRSLTNKPTISTVGSTGMFKDLVQLPIKVQSAQPQDLIIGTATDKLWVALYGQWFLVPTMLNLNSYATKDSVYTKTQVDDLIAEVIGGGDIDLQGYAKTDGTTNISVFNNDANYVNRSSVPQADEEDITNREGKLKFADNSYNPNQGSGKARKYLRKNPVSATVGGFYYFNSSTGGSYTKWSNPGAGIVDAPKNYLCYYDSEDTKDWYCLRNLDYSHFIDKTLQTSDSRYKSFTNTCEGLYTLVQKHYQNNVPLKITVGSDTRYIKDILEKLESSGTAYCVNLNGDPSYTSEFLDTDFIVFKVKSDNTITGSLPQTTTLGVDVYVDFADYTPYLIVEEYYGCPTPTVTGLSVKDYYLDQVVAECDGILNCVVKNNAVYCTLPDDSEVNFSNIYQSSTITERPSNENMRNILTQADFTQNNCIYVIKYDFDLNGATINLPSYCTLRFDGGTLNNGGIICNSCELEGDYLHHGNATLRGSVRKIGATSSRPVTNLNAGEYYFDTSLLRPSWMASGFWCGADGFSIAPKKGKYATVLQGKNLLTSNDIGYQFFDTDLMTPIYLSEVSATPGTGGLIYLYKWVDSIGLVVYSEF